MTEIELYNELQNAEGCLKLVDSQISELRKKKNDIMNDFLSLLKINYFLDSLGDGFGKIVSLEGFLSTLVSPLVYILPNILQFARWKIA